MGCWGGVGEYLVFPGRRARNRHERRLLQRQGWDGPFPVVFDNHTRRTVHVGVNVTEKGGGAVEPWRERENLTGKKNKQKTNAISEHSKK